MDLRTRLRALETDNSALVELRKNLTAELKHVFIRGGNSANNSEYVQSPFILAQNAMQNFWSIVRDVIPMFQHYCAKRFVSSLFDVSYSLSQDMICMFQEYCEKQFSHHLLFTCPILSTDRARTHRAGACRSNRCDAISAATA